MKHVRWIVCILLYLSWPQQAHCATSPIIHIAWLHTFSKANSVCYDPYGQNLERGVKLAWTDFKKEHPDAPFDVVFDKYDYEDSKLKAMDVVDKAARDEAAVGIGFICSDVALLGGKRAPADHLPLLTPTATNDDLSKIGDDVKTAIYTDSFQGSELAKYAFRDLKKRKAMIVVASDCAYCLSLARAYRQSFESLGGQIVGEYNVLTTDVDFTALTTRFKSVEYDSVFLPNYTMQSALIMAAILKSGTATTFLGGDGWTLSKRIYDIIGDDHLDAYFTTSWIPDVQNSKSKKFLQRFGSEFGEEALGTVAHCYDVAALLYQALYRLKSYDRENIMHAFDSLGEYEGITGKFIYRKGKNHPDRTLLVVQVTNGKQKVIRTLNP